MTVWRPITTAPREIGRPLLLYPYPFPRGSVEKMEALERNLRPSEPLLDLSNAAVRQMIKLAKRRGYVTYDELNELLPSGGFSREQIEHVLGQLPQMGINVVGAGNAHKERTESVGKQKVEETRKEASPPAPAEGETDPNKIYFEAPWAVYGRVFEGYWDERKWRTAGGMSCEPTHWTTLPSPPPALVRA